MTHVHTYDYLNRTSTVDSIRAPAHHTPSGECPSPPTPKSVQYKNESSDVMSDRPDGTSTILSQIA